MLFFDDFFNFDEKNDQLTSEITHINLYNSESRDNYLSIGIILNADT